MARAVYKEVTKSGNVLDVTKAALGAIPNTSAITTAVCDRLNTANLARQLRVQDAIVISEGIYQEMTKGGNVLDETQKALKTIPRPPNISAIAAAITLD
jgi:hypothetical protein